MEFYEALKSRRSRYVLTNDLPISDEKLEDILQELILYTPSAFHSQSARVVLLLDEEHTKLWSIVKDTLQKRIPVEKFAPTEKKIQSFADAYGTILFFEDQQDIESLQNAFPTYAEQFPVWSQQSAGMLQFAVWSALAQEGIGASLQHYNPLIDEEVKEVFSLAQHWKLIAQMPFGIAHDVISELERKSIAQRFLVKGNHHD